MLQSIRDRFSGVYAVLIIAVLAVGLTITLIDVDTGSGAGNFAARVNGEEIPLPDFQQVAQQQLLQREQATRGQLPEAEKIELDRDVLEGMVRTRVVAQYVNREGYRASDERVVESIRSLPVFQVNGQFSSDGYLAALASQGVSAAAFEQERRAALQIEQLQNGLLESAFFTPAEYRRFMLLEGERRKAVFAILAPGQVAANLAISEAELKAYYDANPDRFESEESVAIDYVDLQAASLPPAGEPTEEQLRAAYESGASRFEAAAQRRARHILIAVDAKTPDPIARKAATDVKDRLTRGEDFAALAKQYSDDPGSAASGGELGWAGKGTYVEPFEAVLFAQKVGDVSDPVKTEFGYHIIELEEVREGSRQSFDEVREELARELRARGSQDRFFEITEKMDEAALQNPGSLDAAAKVAGVPVRRIEQFTREGGEPLGAIRAVIDAAFSAPVLEDGENSALLEAGEGRAVILRVAEHRPARLRPMEEVASELEAAARMEKASREVAQRGAGIVEAVRSGADFSSAATAAGGALTTPAEALARNSQGVPAEVLAAVFRAARPAKDEPFVGGVALEDGSFAVYRVDAVLPGNPDDVPQDQRDSRKSLLARQTGVADLTALAVDLREASEVVVAPGLFEQPE